MNKLKIIALLVGLLVLSLACGLFLPQGTPTPVPPDRSGTSTAGWFTLNAPSLNTPEVIETETPEASDSETPEEVLPEEPVSPEAEETPLHEPTGPLEVPGGDFLDLPTGTPVADWEGIPIMPGALSGDGDQDGYTFTTQASGDEIQAFYETELSKAGWEPFAMGDSDNDNRMLFFSKDDELVSIIIMDAGKNDGTLLVLLVK